MSVKEDALASQLPDPTNVLLGRLENWNHTVQLLLDFVDARLSIQKSITSGLEKSKKAIAEAPKFDHVNVESTSTPSSPVVAQGPTPDIASPTGQSENEPSGIAEAFDEIRSTTELLINKSREVEQQLKTAVVPQLETLKGDIEKHYKGFKGPGLKGQKDIQSAKATTQKYIESLGQHASSFGAPAGSSAGSKSDAKHDPYIERRLVFNSLQDQISKENAQMDAVISVQNNFQTLERHIVQVLQQATSVIDQIMKGYSSSELEVFGSISNKFSLIQEDYEWNQFVARRGDILVPPDAPKRKIENLTFANIEHKAAVPVIEGILQIKSGKLLKSYSPAYFVLTPTRYLHQFKSQDYVQDPTPELSLYIPDTVVHSPAAVDSGKFKFDIEGKAASKTITTKHKYTIKATTYDEMMQWYNAITKVSTRSDTFNEPSSPTTPIVSSTPTPVAAVAAATVATTAAAESSTQETLGEAPAIAPSEAAPAYTPEEAAADVEHVHIG